MTSVLFNLSLPRLYAGEDSEVLELVRPTKKPRSQTQGPIPPVRQSYYILTARQRDYFRNHFKNTREHPKPVVYAPPFHPERPRKNGARIDALVVVRSKVA